MINSGKQLTRRAMLKSAAALMATPALSAHVIRAGAMNPQPIPSGTIVNGSITVEPTPVGDIGFGFGSLSLMKIAMNQGYPSLNNNLGNQRFCDARNTRATGLLKTLAPKGGILRLGGDNVDYCYWNPKGSGQNGNEISPRDVDALKDFLQVTGYKALYGINLAGAGPNTVKNNEFGVKHTTPALAAAEALYVVNALGIYDPVHNPSGLLYALKLGNEPNLYNSNSSRSFWKQNWSESVYENVWLPFYNAIITAVPHAPIAAPAVSDASWLAPFVANQGRKLSLVTCHHYRTGPEKNPTAASLLTPDTYLTGTVLPALQATGLPFANTESASVYSVGANGVSNSYAAALWTVEYLFIHALAGAKFVAFEAGAPAQTSYSSVSNYYSPIQECFGYVQAIQSEYYGIQFFNMAGQGSLYKTAISSGKKNSSAYAVKASSGGLNVVVLNKDSSPLQLTLKLPAAYSMGSLIEMTQSTSGATMPDITAISGITIQGATVDVDGTFKPRAAYTVKPTGKVASFYAPAYSAILLQFS